MTLFNKLKCAKSTADLSGHEQHKARVRYQGIRDAEKVCFTTSNYHKTGEGFLLNRLLFSTKKV